MDEQKESITDSPHYPTAHGIENFGDPAIGAHGRPTKGRVAFIPFREDMSISSSRNRCYENAEALGRLGWDCQVPGRNPETADVTIFQKRYSPADLALAKRCRGEIIFDLCDPQWLLGNEKDVEAMAQVASCVTTSSGKLAQWFRQRGKNALVMPDSFDFNSIPKVEKNNRFAICWHGNRGNERYLEAVVQPLNKLSEKFDFNLKIVVDPPAARVPRFNFQPQVMDWNLSTYLEEIAKSHIGIAPLFLDEWCSYKSPHKLIIYMALELPVVATATGSRKEIILNGENGFLIKDNDPQEWYEAIKTLITDEKKRSSLVEEGKKIAQAFSLENIAKRWDELFASLLT